MFDKALICFVLAVPIMTLAGEFTVHYEKFELIEYEKVILSNPKINFDPAKQTLNASIYLWFRVNDVRTMQGSVEFFVKENDDYVPTGLRIRKNLCYLWNQDANGFKTKMEKYGNLNFCFLDKGDIYLKNYPLDDSFFPKNLKAGQYKISMKAVLFTMSDIITAVAYVRVKPKNG